MKHSFTLNMTAAAAAEKLKSSMKPLTIFKVFFGEAMTLKMNTAYGNVFNNWFDLIIVAKKVSGSSARRHIIGRFRDLESGKCKLKFRSCLSPWSYLILLLIVYPIYLITGMAYPIAELMHDFFNVPANEFLGFILFLSPAIVITAAAERLTKKQNEAAMFEFLSELFAPERIEG